MPTTYNDLLGKRKRAEIKTFSARVAMKKLFTYLYFPSGILAGQKWD